MNKGQKVALKHAANAIDGTRPLGHIELGANSIDGFQYSSNTTDRHDRPFASVHLARRAGYTPGSLNSAKALVAKHFGLTLEQVNKVERVAASTHNIVQRAQRVATFLRRVAEEPTYVGFTRQATTGAVAASL